MRKKTALMAVERNEMEQSEKARAFLAGLDQTQLTVGNGSDGLPVWIGVDAEAGRVYRIYASGLATGFDNGTLNIFNGIQALGWRVACGEQLTQDHHLMLVGAAAEGLRMYELSAMKAAAVTTQ